MKLPALSKGCWLYLFKSYSDLPLKIHVMLLFQALRPSSLTNIDNSPQSLLAITGNKNVHGLYDILLNHRYVKKHYS